MTATLARENWSNGPCVRVVVDPSLPAGRHRPDPMRVHVATLLRGTPSTETTREMRVVV